MWKAVQDEILKHCSSTHPPGQGQPQPGLGIVVTHGTDTLLETAGYLQRHFRQQQQQQQQSAAQEASVTNISLAVTGAMRPERFSNSDAPWNVGMAVAAIQQQILNYHRRIHHNHNPTADATDVYVCIQGLCLPVDCMRREATTGQFYYHYHHPCEDDDKVDKKKEKE
eukprot:scaffold4052_cov213-Amphora_coffeaeformis.AAC.1